MIIFCMNAVEQEIQAVKFCWKCNQCHLPGTLQVVTKHLLSSILSFSGANIVNTLKSLWMKDVH